MITRKLKPLDMVEQIVDGEHVKNAEQLQRYLLVRAAAPLDRLLRLAQLGIAPAEPDPEPLHLGRAGK